MLPKFTGNTNMESKRQSMQWRHSSSPKAKKFKQASSVRKIMATVFWDRKGILLIDFLERGLTINADAYCETVRKLRWAIQKKDVECCPVGLCFCMTMRDLIPQLELLNCCNNFAGKFLPTRPRAPISRQATTTYSCI